MVLSRLVVFHGLLGVLLLSVQASAAPLRGMRVGQHGGLARVVFDLPQEVPYRLESGPEASTLRLVFPTLSLTTPPPRVQGKNALVQDMRLSTAAGALIVDIVLKQPGAVQYQGRLSNPARLVLDIAPRPGAASTPLKTGTPASQPAASVAVPPAVAPAASPQPPPAAPATPPARTTLPAGPPPNPNVSLASLSPPQLLQRAEQHWAARQIEAAQRAYTTLLQRYPEYPNNHLVAARIADILREQQHPRAALEAYTAVVQGYPGSEGALLSQIRLAELGIAFPDLLPPGDEPRYAPYRQPLASMQRLIADYPFSPLADVARFKIGEIALRQREFDAALESFETLLARPIQEALRQDVANSLRQALLQLLTDQHQRGAFLDVLRTFFAHKQALRPMEALHSDLLLPVALSYAELGLLDEAQSLFVALLPRLSDPAQQTRLLFEQALRFAQQGQLRMAASLLTPPERLTTPAQQAQALVLLSQDAWQTGQPAETVRYGQQALTLLTEPATRALLWNRLAAAYEARGERQQAIHALQQCAEEARAAQQAVLGAQAETCLLQATTLQAQGETPAQMLASYEHLLHAFPASSQNEAHLFRIADLHRQQGDNAQMLATFRRLREHSSETFWQKVATEYLEQAQWQERLQERLAAFQNSLMR
ncbi:MAG: tetratricopeptide repeat protein [Candidatus Tectimicrobiota bacterium]